MRKRLSLMLVAVCCLVTATAQKKQDLRILFVGGSSNYDTISQKVDSAQVAESAGERMASFTKMLKRYFKVVKSIPGKDYRQEMSDEYDVTVFDGKFPAKREKGYTYSDDGRVTGVISPIYFTDDFDRPALTIAEMGEDLGRSLGIKSDWYCLCLAGDAHSWVKNHPIFQGPFPVKLNVTMQPTPAGAKEYAKMVQEPLPDSIPMWKVQTKDYENTKGFRIGMVSRPNGFGDPDDEYISSGLCAKSIDAVALGRHANFFHWGFSASPDDMTKEGKQVFANAIVYIAKFAGQRPIARKLDESISTRRMLEGKEYTCSRQGWADMNRMNDEFNATVLGIKKTAQEKKAKGEPLEKMEEIYLNFTPQPNPTYDEYLKRQEPEMYHFFGTDTEMYLRYYKNNAPYFYAQGYKLVVDEDARELGIANNDRRLLDTAIRMLEENKNTDQATRLLHRYTLCRFATPAEWRNWYEANKDRLFFSEGGGFLWLVNTQDTKVEGNDYGVLDASAAPAGEQPQPAGKADVAVGTDERNPVVVSGSVETGANGAKELVIRVQIHPGYHIYAQVSDKDPFIPTTFDIKLPSGWKTEGELQLASFTQLNENGTTVYTNESVFRQPISGAGRGDVQCTVNYQCCDENVCFPPASKTINITIE